MDPIQPILKIMKPNDTYSHRNFPISRGSSCRRGKVILNWSDRAGVDGKYPATWKFWFRHKPLLAENRTISGNEERKKMTISMLVSHRLVYKYMP